MASTDEFGVTAYKTDIAEDAEAQSLYAKGKLARPLFPILVVFVILSLEKESVTLHL